VRYHSVTATGTNNQEHLQTISDIHSVNARNKNQLYRLVANLPTSCSQESTCYAGNKISSSLQLSCTGKYCNPLYVNLNTDSETNCWLTWPGCETWGVGDSSLLVHWGMGEGVQFERLPATCDNTWNTQTESNPLLTSPQCQYNFNSTNVPNVVVEWLSLLHIREDLGSNFGLQTGYPERGFPQSLHRDSGIIPQVRPRPVPSTSF
jgi:hypothetical protein